MIKKDQNDTRYIYALLCFIKLMKLCIESKIEQCSIAIEIVLRRLVMLLILIGTTTEFIETSQICMTCTKYCRKQPNIQQSMLLSANQGAESVFLNRHFLRTFICFVYFVYSFNIFLFGRICFSFLYLAQIFGKSFIQMGELRGRFRTQSNIYN